MKHIFKIDETEYEFELHKITPKEFDRLRNNGALTWDDDKFVYKLHDDVVATEISRKIIYNKFDTVPVMLSPVDFPNNQLYNLRSDELLPNFVLTEYLDINKIVYYDYNKRHYTCFSIGVPVGVIESKPDHDGYCKIKLYGQY